MLKVPILALLFLFAALLVSFKEKLARMANSLPEEGKGKGVTQRVMYQ